MRIVAVTDRRQCTAPFPEQLRKITESGADMVVLREKDLSSGEYEELAVIARDLCRTNGIVFCINSFTDVAYRIGAKCVWVPYSDFITEGRPDIVEVGVSVHSIDEAKDAEKKGADFLIYGNVFETTCKPGKEAKGFEEITRICKECRIPVYAIGGIGPSNAHLLKDTGVSGICMMSAFMKEEDPASLVGRVKDSFRNP